MNLFRELRHFRECVIFMRCAFFVKCDIHPWMKSWVHVLDHPFFSVTKEDGKFEITGLPAGKFELEFWHEKLGASHQVVSVAAGEAMELAYQFSKE